MAQGFVKNLNLQESATRSSDRQILDNLGGVNISQDILLFDANTRFSSILQNDPDFTEPFETAFSGVISGERYRVTDQGQNRDWTQVGSPIASPPINYIFTASTPSATLTGSDGLCRKVIGRIDFEKYTDTLDGVTYRVIGSNKVAFSNETTLSINAGVTYPYIVYNSNGTDTFQLTLADGYPDTITALDLGDISVIDLYRSDVITAANINNMSPETTVINDEDDSNLAEGSGGEDDTDVSGLDIDEEFTPFDKTSYVGNIVGNIEYKKTRVPVTYKDNLFDERVRFKGSVTIVNTDLLGVGQDRGITSALVQGKKYKITDPGNTGQAVWQTLGATNGTLNEEFTATNAVGSGSGRVISVNPPGLFIVNAATGDTIRAFSGTDNPWLDTSTSDAATPAFIDGDALMTTSSVDKAQVSKLVIKPNTTTDNIKLVRTNAGRTAVDTLVSADPQTTNNYKIPIVVNGEQYYILAKIS